MINIYKRAKKKGFINPMTVSVILAFIIILPIKLTLDFLSSGEKGKYSSEKIVRDGVTKTEYGKEIIKGLNTRVDTLPSELEKISERSVEGYYKKWTPDVISPLDIMFLSWNRIKDTVILPDEIYERYKRYDGVMLFRVRNRRGTATTCGVWKLTDRYTYENFPQADSEIFNRDDTRLIDFILFMKKPQKKIWEYGRQFADPKIKNWNLGFMDMNREGIELFWFRSSRIPDHSHLKQEDMNASPSFGVSQDYSYYKQFECLWTNM